MSVTDELRRILDKRGVEWWPLGSDMTECVIDGIRYKFRQVGRGLIVSTCTEGTVTPEQAIAITLGRGTCHNVAEPDEYSDRPFTCSECGARGPMGNGTYHLARSVVMEDGTRVFADSWPVWKYCPACGAKVVDPTTNDADAEVAE